MVKKVIQVALASLLVFFVAAPVIVGVYDASNTETSITRGNIEGYERDGGLYSIVSTGLSKPDSSEDESFNASLHDEELWNTLADWYSGDSSISDSLASGNASLIYEFSDGTTVDFGNPYVLDWSDVSPPDDYYEVLASVEAEQASIFAPEKAYAGPISWLSGKLKYLAIKSGYWKTFNSMLYSLGITIAMSGGMSYTSATQCVNKIVAELPAITRVITSETAAFTTEDTAMLVSNAITRVAARKVAVSDFPAALNAEIAANVTAVETTGMLLGGGSGNFVNALYKLAATGGVPASILYSDLGLYIGSWLGGNFNDKMDGYPEAETVGTFDFSSGDQDLSIVLQTGVPEYASIMRNSDYEVNSPGFYGWDNWVFYTYDTVNDYYVYGIQGHWSQTDIHSIREIEDGSSRYMKYDLNNVYTFLIKDGKNIGSGGPTIKLDSGQFTGFTINQNLPVQVVYADGSKINLSTDGSIETTGSAEGVVNTVESGADVSLIGQGAEFDADGNLINAGNVSVPDITSPGYIQPGTFSEALDQMQSMATIEKPAQSTSPTIGNSSTVGDWVNQNTPTTPDPSEESSQDDFKIEDLEKVFPFCIPWDLYYLLAIFTADPVAPNFNWHFNFAMAGEYDFNVDLSPFDSVAQVCRVCETVLFCVGLALVTRNLIRG